MNLIEIECKDVDWFHVAEISIQWQTPADIIMNLQVP
jgi:hypothetical protein